ncbi:hypothetical protein BDF14DRAFT_1879622 [Spinellus fusiger]|nr:hypothetical protein BDF14DRAFT_1879622 [Spinellus fusiger]
MDILQFYSSTKNIFTFSEFLQSHKADVVRHSLEIEVKDENDWVSLKDAWYSILNDFKSQNADVEVHVLRENKRKISETLNEHADTVGSVMESPSLSFENPFLSTSNPSLGNLFYEHKIKEVRSKVKCVAELSKQDMMYFGILDFSQNIKKNILQEALGMNDYNIFKTEFTTRIETRASAVKLFYFIIKPVDYVNENSYLYFVLSPIFKNLLCNHPRVSLLFGEVNLKAKAIEVNRYLYEDQRRLAGPKIDIIVKDTKYNIEIMIIEVSGAPNKISQTHFLEDRNKICKNLKAMFEYIVSKMEVPSVTLVKKLRLFGLQFYNDEVYVYSLCQSSVLIQLMPSFFKNFYAISHLIENTHDILDKMLGTIDKSQDVLRRKQRTPKPTCLTTKEANKNKNSRK